MQEEKIIAYKEGTLKALLTTYHVAGNIRIVNECMETLVAVGGGVEAVIGLDKSLSEDLLDRRVIDIYGEDGCLEIRVEGNEDAE